VVDVDSSIAFYEALRHYKVPAEMHLYGTEEWMQPLFG